MRLLILIIHKRIINYRLRVFQYHFYNKLKTIKPAAKSHSLGVFILENLLVLNIGNLLNRKQEVFNEKNKITT
jgi:hypothetical protein